MTITLPYPPSANRYWRTFNGRIVMSAEARAYKEGVALIARAKGLRPSDGDVTLKLDVFRPQRRGDLDNRIKIVLDALQGVAYYDDKQVIEIHARRFDAGKDARVEVTILKAAPIVLR